MIAVEMTTKKNTARMTALRRRMIRQ